MYIIGKNVKCKMVSWNIKSKRIDWCILVPNKSSQRWFLMNNFKDFVQLKDTSLQLPCRVLKK